MEEIKRKVLGKKCKMQLIAINRRMKKKDDENQEIYEKDYDNRTRKKDEIADIIYIIMRIGEWE